MTNFIDQLAPLAQKHGKAASVLPSLILAQGILESDSGKSVLATKANNLFGIKKGSGWTGAVYAKDSKEYSDNVDREGNVIGWFSVVSEFRKYPSFEGAVRDLVYKYAQGLDWEPHNRYSAVVGEKDYKKAARAIFDAGYATDPEYPEKLTRVIEQYDLTQYDEKEVGKVAKAEDFLIVLDDGHGPHTAGKRTPYIASLGRQIRENEFNKPVVNYLEAELKRCGFRTLQLAPTDLDTPLTTRTNTANKAEADALISIHFNAMGSTFAYSSAKGFSVHIQEGLSNTSGAYKLAKLMTEELAKGTPQTNRGVVKQNLAITRQSAMTAVLVECGFMDDPTEALLMINKSFQQEVARELAMATCRHFGVAYVPEKETVKPASPIKNETKYYRVRKSWAAVKSQVGAFKSFAIAKAAADKVGLNVYDAKGTLVHTGKVEKLKEEKPMAEKYKQDAAPSKSLATEFNAAVKAGITDGTYPQRPVTREEAAVMAYRASKK